MIIPVQLFAAEVYNCFASVSAVFSDHSTEFQHLRTNATIKQDELQIIAGNAFSKLAKYVNEKVRSAKKDNPAIPDKGLVWLDSDRPDRCISPC